MHRRWVVKKTNPEYISYLVNAASVSPLFAQILVSRNISTAAGVRDFVDAGMLKMSDPFDIPGMRQAIEKIKAVRSSGGTMLVHGDYDADGITATAIMVEALVRSGIDVRYFIPHRITHGYGFNNAGVEAARSAGAKLILTVDCGIGSFEAAEYARSLGIDVIISDHHEPVRREPSDPEGPGFLLPNAAAVINPKCSPSSDGLDILSGAGLAFKISHAMALDRDIPFLEDDLVQLLDLAALGTIADVVPLIGENRMMVKDAMQYIQGGSRPGLLALKTAAGLDGRKLRANSLSFSLVPRINAAGRVSDANDVVKLLLSRSEEEAEELASWVDSLNTDRQKIEESVYYEALEMLKASPPDGVAVLAKEGWHPGVIGIVASKIAEAFHMPAFIFSVSDGIAKGSCRSVKDFDVCRALGDCGDILLAYGGHKQAAGLKLRADDIDTFNSMMRKIVRRDMPEEYMPELEIHAGARLDEVSRGLLQELDLLEPFGCGNPEPVLGSKELSAIDPRIVGTGHLKLKLNNGTVSHDAIGFNMGQHIDDLSSYIRVDAAYTPSWNEWNGNRYVQLVLKGLRPSR
jgi:single-stranded-DNA-specific exonuclease